MRLRFIKCALIAYFSLTFRFNEPLRSCSQRSSTMLFASLRTTQSWMLSFGSHVCRLWRSVVIADRRIWNPLCLHVYVERTFALIRRAGPTNIDLQIRDTEDNPFSKDPMTQLIDRLFIQLPFIRRLEIFFHSCEAVIHILDRPRQHISRHDLFAWHGCKILPSPPLFGGVVVPSFTSGRGQHTLGSRHPFAPYHV